MKSSVKQCIHSCVRGGLVLIMGFALSACSSTPTQPKASEYPALKQAWLNQQAVLKGIKQWGIKGKAAIRSEQGSGTVSLFWSHNQDNNALKIIAPFGRGTLNIKADAKQATLIDAQGKTHSAATMKGLVWLKTGFEIPFDDLQKWMLGIAPNPDSPSLVISPQGQTMGFVHDGWIVRYIGFSQQTIDGKSQLLPKKIYLNNPSIGEKFSVKLAVRDWVLSAN